MRLAVVFNFKSNCMQKILVALKIVQIVDNEKRNKQGLKRMGKGYFKAYRLNPFNPLCYIVLCMSSGTSSTLSSLHKTICAIAYTWC